MPQHGIVCALLAYPMLHVHIVNGILGNLEELTVMAYAKKLELINNLVHPWFSIIGSLISNFL